MAKKPEVFTQVTPVFTVREYTYKTIKIDVGIDFKTGKVSLLDKEGKDKKWVFASRELEFMDGWRDILDAMKYAIDQATEELEAYYEMVAERNSF